MARTCSAAWMAAVCAIAIGVGGQLTTEAVEQTPKPKAPLTMTGCLRADRGSFILTDLKGNQAPKKRSWKTAFITKTTKDLVVSPSTGVNLKTQVDRQVTVVGVVDGSHMTARSVKRVAASCA